MLLTSPRTWPSISSSSWTASTPSTRTSQRCRVCRVTSAPSSAARAVISPVIERLGYTEADHNRLLEIAGGGPLASPEDIRRIIDNYQYLDDWRTNYKIQSVRSSLHNSRITCIDAAILSYGLLEMLCGDVKRRL